MNEAEIFVVLVVNIGLATLAYFIKNKALEKVSKIENILIFIFSVIFPILSVIMIVYYGIKLIINKKGDVAEAFDKKTQEIKTQLHEHKVRKIAEEESIRSNVQQSFENADEKDLEDLQDLINKAVAKGDSETAQALLKILNSHKEKNK